MVAIRKSFEEGHKRKFLVIIDGTPECDRAICYAAKRAERTGGLVCLFYVVEPGDFQHWLGVESVMRQDAVDAGWKALGKAREKVQNFTRNAPELVLREGRLKEEILTLIEADTDIAILVLAAAAGGEGPGPLVASFSGKNAGSFPLPITLIPPGLSVADIAALA